MKRTSKRYVVTTESLNCYGYRVLTNGIDISQYLNNPILLWMHQRADGKNKDQILPLGRAVDIEVKDGVMTCALEFDDTDVFAMQVYNKYENGTLNMLSLGAKPLEWSDRPEQMVAGQTGPTFTKSKMIDISCVDIGGNDDALPVRLYDLNDNVISLSLSNSNILSLLAKDNKPLASSIKHDPITLAIVTNAINAGKFNKEFATGLLSLGNDQASVDAILLAVKACKIKPENIAGDVSKYLQPQLALSWDEIYRHIPGGFLQLKEQAPEVYKAKYFEKYGRLPLVRDGRLL